VGIALSTALKRDTVFFRDFPQAISGNMTVAKRSRCATTRNRGLWVGENI
jgi:hypothetical protein